MVDIKAVKTWRFTRGLAKPMFTTMSSQVGKLTYVEVVDVAVHIEIGRMEKKASKLPC